MAKYLVFSDSHGDDETMLGVVKEHKKDVDGIFFLGDAENSGDRLRNSVQGPVYMVRGNCDWSLQASDFQCFQLHGHRVALTHGHRQHVNTGLDTLKYWALEKEADVVLFGHTHVPFAEQTSTLTVLNPGSISRPRQEGYRKTYAMLEFLANGEIKIEQYHV